MQEIISIREFARRVGVSDAAIRKAISSGRISKAVGRNPANGRPTVDYAMASEEWAASGGGAHSTNYTPTAVSQTIRAAGNTDAANLGGAQAKSQPADAVTMVAAKKAQAVYIAKIKELEYRKMAGILVEKDQVYKALFAFGQELRNNLLNIPDRIMPDIRAAVTDSEAHAMLYEAIANELDKLSEMAQRPLTSDR